MRDAGRIGFVPMNEYNNEETYEMLDVVTYQHSSYVAKKETAGNPPAENNEFWQLIAKGVDPDAYYTRKEVAALIAGIKTTEFKIVDALPTNDISTSTIYLVQKDGAPKGNVYSEYIYINGSWESIGDTEIKLDDYLPKIGGIITGDLEVEGTIHTNVITSTGGDDPLVIKGDFSSSPQITKRSNGFPSHPVISMKTSDILAQSDVLDDLQEIKSVADRGYIAGAMAVKEITEIFNQINSNLVKCIEVHVILNEITWLVSQGGKYYSALTLDIPQNSVLIGCCISKWGGLRKDDNIFTYLTSNNNDPGIASNVNSFYTSSYVDLVFLYK